MAEDIIAPDDRFTILDDEGNPVPEEDGSSVPDILDEVRSVAKGDPELLGLIDELAEALSGMDEEDEAEAREDMAFLHDITDILKTVMSLGDDMAGRAASCMARDMGTRYGTCDGGEWRFTKQGLEDAVKSVQASAVKSFAETLLLDTGRRLRLSDDQRAAVKGMTKTILESLGQGWDE